MQQLARIDTTLLKWAYQKPFNNGRIIKALIFMGDAPFWMFMIVMAALVGQLFNLPSFEQLTVSLMLGFAIGNLILSQLKVRVSRKRPYANLTLQEKLQISIENRDPGHGSKEFESFPSGHVFWTTLCVSLICYQFSWSGFFAVSWMVPTMIFLRPHLGVHYPSDALAGFIIGILLATITLVLLPFVLDYLDNLKNYSGYFYGYWVFIMAFLVVGIKSWKKRV